MALANIAVLLAGRGCRVLCVDFDLEAPGLDRYFAPHGLRSEHDQAGLIDLLCDARSAHPPPDYGRYVSRLDVGSVALTVMTCGRQDENYAKRVLDFQWGEFFAKHAGGAFFEELRARWVQDFDFVLIDSRTGLTDAGGVCTVQLPDILVPVFTTNDQSVEGVRDVILRAQAARQQLAYDRAPLLVFPLPSRFDGRTEFEKSLEWLGHFKDRLGCFFDDWLPKSYDATHVFERVKIPYVAYFSFGENLPVLTHGTRDPEGIGFAFNQAATLLASRFASIESVLGLQPDGGRDALALPDARPHVVLLASQREAITAQGDSHSVPPVRTSRQQTIRSLIVQGIGTGLIAVAMLAVYDLLPTKNTPQEFAAQRAALAVANEKVASQAATLKQKTSEAEQAQHLLYTANMWQAVAQSSAFIQDVEDASRSFVSSKEAEVLGANEQLDELAARADQLQQSIAGLQQGAVANNKQGELEPRAVLEGARADLNEGRSLLSELQKKLSVKATAAIAGETSARTSARQAWNRGYQQFLSERYERARHEYESAIKLDSTYAPAYNSLGRLDLMSGDVPAARVHFENALAHDKQYVPALSNLALVYVKLAEDTKGDPKLRDTNLEHASGFVGEALKLSNYQPARRIRARIESMRAK